jgi:hypothetical protein
MFSAHRHGEAECGDEAATQYAPYWVVHLPQLANRGAELARSTTRDPNPSPLPPGAAATSVSTAMLD